MISTIKPPGKLPAKKHPLLSACIPPVIVVTVLLAVWEAAVSWGSLPGRDIPSPSRILESAVLNGDSLSYAAYITASEAVAGFAIAIIAGILGGVGLYTSKILYSALFPLLAGAQALPLITIAPLFVIWFGYEPPGKAVLVAIFSIFPIAVQTCRGLMAVPQYFSDVALTCGATRSWALWHVQMRVAARQIFSGIRISATYIFITATTAEYVGARAGIGIWIQSAYVSRQSPMGFAATFVILILTGIILSIIAAVEWLALGPPGSDSID